MGVWERKAARGGRIMKRSHGKTRMTSTLTKGHAMTDTPPLPCPATLADLRKAAGLSQKDVATRMGVGQARISQIEQDYPNLKFPVITAYVEALGGHIALTGIAGRTVPASDVRPTHRDPESALKRRRLQRKGIARLDATAAFSLLPPEELVLQGEQPHTSGNDTRGQIDHPDPQRDQSDSGQCQQS